MPRFIIRATRTSTTEIIAPTRDDAVDRYLVDTIGEGEFEKLEANEIGDTDYETLTVLHDRIVDANPTVDEDASVDISFAEECALDFIVRALLDLHNTCEGSDSGADHAAALYRFLDEIGLKVTDR